MFNFPVKYVPSPVFVETVTALASKPLFSTLATFVAVSPCHVTG